MKTILVCAGIVLLVLGGYFIGNKLFPADHSNLANNPGKLEGAGKLIVAKQVQTYSDLQVKHAWVISDAMVYYKWQSLNEWGVDFGSGQYDLKLNESNGIVSVTVPDLQYFGPKIPLEHGKFVAQVVNKGWFISELNLIRDYFDVINTIVNDDGINMLKDSDLIKLCRDTIGINLLNIFNQARDTKKYIGIRVIFSNEESTDSTKIQAVFPHAEYKMSLDETKKANLVNHELKDYSSAIQIKGKEKRIEEVRKK